MQEELKTLKSENNAASAKLQQEKENLQKDLGTKTEEVQEKAKLLIQVNYIIEGFLLIEIEGFVRNI